MSFSRLGRVRRRIPAAGLITSGVVLTGCAVATGQASPPAPTGSPYTVPSMVPAAAAAQLVPPGISPLTGLSAVVAPVVAVKIDNVYDGKQTGLNQADVVYCELVEGGLTRLLAVFDSQHPTRVGPVRSARVSDIALLGQYGRIALAFSGANSGVLATIRQANLQVDAYDYFPRLYVTNTRNPRPYTFQVDTAAVAATAPGVAARGVGFTFGDPSASAAAASTPVQSVAAHYPATTVTATWDAAENSWRIARNGRNQDLTDGTQASATNVLIQYVQISGSRYTDHNGLSTPVSATVGSGAATLLRGGRSYLGRWRRDTSEGPTRWTGSDGGTLVLAPGRTWVLLLPVGSAVASSANPAGEPG